MSSGLSNAAQTFQRFISEVTRRLEKRGVLLDDISVAIHLQGLRPAHLHALFDQLDEHGVTKCELKKPIVTFCGNTVSTSCVAALAGVTAIQGYTQPHSYQQLHLPVCVINVFRHFVLSGLKSMLSSRTC